MRRSVSSDISKSSHISGPSSSSSSTSIIRGGGVLVKSRSEAVIRPMNKKNKSERISPINSDDEDEEDEEQEDPEEDEDEYQDAQSETQSQFQAHTQRQSVIFNTSTSGLDKVARNSVININNIVNINNGPSSPPTNEVCKATSTTISNKARAESYPQSEVESLRKELKEKLRGMDKLKKQNQKLEEENLAMKKLLEAGFDHPKAPVPLSASIAVVKVGYLHKRGYTWHNWCSRWCVLRWNTLTYYKTPSDTKPKGLFHVQGCEVAEHHDPKKPHTFTVQSRTRLWYFQATSQNEQRSWMHAISTAATDRSSFSKSDTTIDNQVPMTSRNKLFKFFGEEPTRDWCEEDIIKRQSSKMDLANPVPTEMVEFVSEKEARVIDECGLSLKQAYVNYPAFLSCAYFVTRDRFFKKRISEYKTLFKAKAAATGTTDKAETNNNTNNNNTISNENHHNNHNDEKSHRPRSNRYSVKYTDSALGNLLSMQNPRDQYTFFEKVGKGGFANVFRAKHKGNKSIVAVKVLSQKFEKRNARMCHEVSMLMTCNHPNIIKNIQNFLYNEEIYMVTEYCEIGSLDRVLKLELKEPAISFIIGQVLNGLVYLHNLGRVHRDIKTSNILINSLGHVKIADLGLCEDIRNGPIMGKMSGSKYWLAPEVVARQPYGTAVDIWNLGALACAMVTRSPPNGSMHPIKAMYLATVQGVSVTEILGKNAEWSDHFRDFMTQCFKMDPATRPTAVSLLQHPFLKAGKRADLVPLVNACIIAGYIV